MHMKEPTQQPLAKSITRRKAIASLGILSGTALVHGCATRAPGESVAPSETGTPLVTPAASQPTAAWDYVKLDPHAVGQRAYQMYPDGGCMYAVVGSVIQTLAERVGQPFSSFPIAMMRYGSGGIGGLGSVCGIVNGAAALIGLLQDKQAKDRREALIHEVCTWYEQTPLPVYRPAEPAWAEEVTPSMSGSVLCHVAVGQWCKTAGSKVHCAERKERCRRVSADGAIQLVDLLNRNLAIPDFPCGESSPKVKTCLQCHGSKELDDSIGRMNCTTCHSFQEQHP